MKIWIVQKNDEDGFYIENIKAYCNEEAALTEARRLSSLSDDYEYLKGYRCYQVECIDLIPWPNAFKNYLEEIKVSA